MNPQLTFIARLRRERQRNGISLDQIASRSRIKLELLEAFENNDLTDWPRGLYARAWVRAYAVAVGLDPADTVDEFCRLYLHGDRRARATIREIAVIAASDSQYLDEFAHEERRHGAPQAAPPAAGRLAHVWRAVRGRLAPILATFHLKHRRSPHTS